MTSAATSCPTSVDTVFGARASTAAAAATERPGWRRTSRTSSTWAPERGSAGNGPPPRRWAWRRSCPTAANSPSARATSAAARGTESTGGVMRPEYLRIRGKARSRDLGHRRRYPARLAAGPGSGSRDPSFDGALDHLSVPPAAAAGPGASDAPGTSSGSSTFVSPGYGTVKPLPAYQTSRLPCSMFTMSSVDQSCFADHTAQAACAAVAVGAVVAACTDGWGFVSVNAMALGTAVYGVKSGLSVNTSFIGSAVMSSWFIGERPRICSIVRITLSWL